MKISSRSLLSPGRPGPRDQPPTPISLSTSLSRRLRNSRSIKGGASPAMFPATSKKRGAFDNPEPSSPKVTCIGQVRVKTKKKHAAKKNLTRSLSRRRSTGDGGSFRKLDHSRSLTQLQNQECLQGQRNNQNQRWVHLPLTICEALRTFGSEFSCLFPCRSSCSSTTMEKQESMVEERGSRQGSCGAVFARWLVALQEGDGGRDASGGGGGVREIELVAGDDNEEEMDDVRNSTRHHVFQDLEIVNDIIMGTKDEARVSICVPPKNALLLMRCRSDPVKMEALTNRFWEPTVDKNEEEDEECLDDEERIEEKKIIPQEDVQLQEEEKVVAFVEANDQEVYNDLQNDAIDQEKVETNFEMETIHSVKEEIVIKNQEMETKQSFVEEEKVTTNPEMEVKQSIETYEGEEEEESMFLWTLFEENAEEEEEEAHSDVQEEFFDDVQEELFEDVQETQAWESSIDKVKKVEEKTEEMVTEFTERSKTPNETHEEDVIQSKEVEFGVIDRKNEEKDSSERLPECLLLMMYEPKLSMEVSKETWVCSSDFIRHRSSRKKPPPPPPVPVKSIEGQDESNANASSPSCGKEHDNQVMRMAAIQHQPARSSCSMAIMLEQKLGNTMGIGYEPLVLTRCKSEPMRTASAKLAPETCFWKNKLEPPRRASFGIGMAGLGF